MRADPRRRRRTATLVGALCLAAGFMLRAGGEAPRAAPLPVGTEALECDGIRRLADNYLLDLQIRFVFEAGGRYRRFEDAGRGWIEVAAGGRWRAGPGARVILQQDAFVTAYIERLSGAYYYIDRSGATLSVWGHCGVSTPPRTLF